jgi:hypothetical protein
MKCDNYGETKDEYTAMLSWGTGMPSCSLRIFEGRHLSEPYLQIKHFVYFTQLVISQGCD